MLFILLFHFTLWLSFLLFQRQFSFCWIIFNSNFLYYNRHTHWISHIHLQLISNKYLLSHIFTTGFAHCFLPAATCKTLSMHPIINIYYARYTYWSCCNWWIIKITRIPTGLIIISRNGGCYLVLCAMSNVYIRYKFVHVRSIWIKSITRLQPPIFAICTDARESVFGVR